jgi:hypothetical protein
VLRESRRSVSLGCRNFFQRSLFAMRTFLCAFYYKAKSAFRTSLFRLFRFVRPHEYTFFVISGRDPLRWVFARVAPHMLGKTVPGEEPVFQMVPGMKSEGRNGRTILPELEKSRIGISCGPPNRESRSCQSNCIVVCRRAELFSSRTVITFA